MGGAKIFEVELFFAAAGWKQVSQLGKNGWTGQYRRGSHNLAIHSRSGVGDVVANLNGRGVIAECKKGPLITKPGSPERPLLATALGQALLFEADPSDIVGAAVLDTAAFRRIAEDWRVRPLLQRAGIGIWLVNRNGKVDGFSA